MPAHARGRVLLDAEHRADVASRRACGTRSPRYRKAGAWSRAPRSAVLSAAARGATSPLTSIARYSSRRRAPQVAEAVDAERLPDRSARARLAASARACAQVSSASGKLDGAVAATGPRARVRDTRPCGSPAAGRYSSARYKLVNHERLDGQARSHSGCQRAARIRRVRRHTAQCRSRRRITCVHSDKLRAREIAPQDVQALVPVIELLVVRALEARAPEAEHLQVVAESRGHHGSET